MQLLEGGFEKFSRFTQKWVGLDCFFWAMICTIISMFFHIGIAAATHSKPILCLLFTYAAFKEVTKIFLIPKIKRRAYQALAQGFENELKVSMSATRTYSLKVKMFYIIPGICICFGLYGINTMTLFFLLILFHDYPPAAFNSCTPLPSGESKVKKMLKRLRQAIVLKSENPLPA